MEGTAMSLSPWEQDALDSIRDGLADSDPGLVERLAMFTRLASGEAMPVREKIQVVSQRVVRRGTRRGRRLYQRLNLGRAMLLVWLVTTLALIAAALATSRASGAVTCPGSTAATACSGATPTQQAARPFP
jgi:hypothetical protein